MIIDRLLKKISEITAISATNIDLLLSCAHQLELSKKKCILNEGEICSFLYFVENGYLRTYINQEGKEININFTFEGNFTSNLKSLKTKQPSEHSIEAGERSLVTLFDSGALLELYSRFPEIEILCRRILGSLLIETNDQLDFYKLHTPLERYQYLIKNKPQMIKRIPVSQLSSYIGVARETLSRLRKYKV